MRRSSSLLLLAILASAVFFQACSSPKPDEAKLAADARAAGETAVRAASVAWSSASQAKDLEKATAVYSDDAVVFPDGQPIETTKADIRAGWQSLFSVPDSSLTWKTTAVHVAQAGDMAYEYGAYTFTTADKQGRIKTQTGKYVVIWKKQADNSWKVVIDIDNKDPLPVAPRPAASHHAAKKHSKGRASRHR